MNSSLHIPISNNNNIVSSLRAGQCLGAGEKAPSPGCCCVAERYCGGKVATILKKFGHILAIYTGQEFKRNSGEE